MTSRIHIAISIERTVDFRVQICNFCTDLSMDETIILQYLFALKLNEDSAAMPYWLSNNGIIFFVFTSICLIILAQCSDDLEGPPDTAPELLTVEDAGSVVDEPELNQYGFEKGVFNIEEHRIQRNESLYLILRRYGVSPVEIDRIQRQASQYANLNRLRPGQLMEIYLEEDTVAGFVWNIDRLEHLVVRWQEDEVEVYRDRHELNVVEKKVEGTIESSLFLSLLDQGAPRLLASELANIFAWQIDFFTLRRGDSYELIYDELYVEGHFYGIGEIHAAKFQHRGEIFRAFRFEGDTQSGYFDEEGNSLQKALLKAPFRYSQRVSSGFSHNRFHPILQERRPHYGVDYAAPRGTPVIAVGDGVITEAQYRGGNGNIIQIRHNSTYRTAYLHLDRFASGVRRGTTVEQGQVIGYVGATGLATGPHLCYRLYVGDQPVNSLTVELPSSESLREEYRGEFAIMVDQYLNRFDGGQERLIVEHSNSGSASRLSSPDASLPPLRR